MNPLTLASAVDEINDARLFHNPLAAWRCRQLASFLASRQGLPGSYAGLFAPVDGELRNGYRLPTGQRITTRAGSHHVLGEEALRALILLRPTTASARSAIQRAVESMSLRLHESESQHAYPPGIYCCMRCSLALWRVWSLGVMPHAAHRLRCGIQQLRQRRLPAGNWAGYPFHYTLSALLDAQTDEARDELRHARPAVQRRLNRSDNSRNIYAARRRRLLECALQAVA